MSLEALIAVINIDQDIKFLDGSILNTFAS